MLFIVSLTSCDKEKRELYSHIDYFVDKLDLEYQSYGLLGGVDDTKYTQNGKYKIMPIGRLINVKIEETSTDEDYENLLNDLKSHYENDNRVNKVYRCQAGTLMVDCRN